MGYPATWYEIHMKALECKTLDEKKEFHKWLFEIGIKMERTMCGTCGKHVLTYLMKNPPNYDNLFYWTVDFHNDVNERLKKKIFSYEEATRLYKKI
jgi:FAD-linked sulfhydryl oxidase